MRVLADLTTNSILQAGKTPDLGVAVPVNGKYVVAIPDGSAVQVTRDSVILPTSDPNSIVAQAYAGLLAQLPQYESILYNPLLTDSDIDDLDLTGTITLGTDTFSTRVQTGRGTAGPLVSGNAPNSTALLPVNDTLGIGNDRPGCLITNTIDISPLLPPAPPGECFIPAANEFVLWWKLYDFQTSEDVRSSFGKFSGSNDPALREIIEVDQEPSGLEVYISSDDGQSWERANLLEPVSTCAGVSLRVAFLNFSTSRLYLAAYAVIF